MTDSLILTVLIIVALAFTPSVIYLVWVRRAEMYARESWSDVLKTFLWGAVFAVIIAVVLSLVASGVLFSPQLGREYSFLQDRTAQSLILVCVIAPFVEEFAKVLGVFNVKSSVLEPEDGLVFGAACGLGFAATENLLYEGTAYLEYGFGMTYISTVVARSVASTLLHGSASALAGYGLGKWILNRSYAAIPFYLIAVFMHGAFNFLASVQLIASGDIPILALLAAIIFAVSSFGFIRRKIVKLDRRGG